MPGYPALPSTCMPGYTALPSTTDTTINATMPTSAYLVYEVTTWFLGVS
jgi:hypothetical protein